MGDERKPSLVFDDYWIHADSEKRDFKEAEGPSWMETFADPNGTWFLEDGSTITTSELKEMTKSGINVTAELQPRTSTGSGKWMLFTPINELDITWAKVKKLTEQGKLGRSAKTATMKENKNASIPEEKPIIVYANESDDFDEVTRIVWTLYEENLIPKLTINYKTDRSTTEGKYSQSGRPVSRYSISKKELDTWDNYKDFLAFFKLKY